MKVNKNDLTTTEIKSILYAIDLVLQNFGENEELERIYQKLLKASDLNNE